MSRLLAIEVSPRADHSTSRKLTAVFIKQWKAATRVDRWSSGIIFRSSTFLGSVAPSARRKRTHLMRAELGSSASSTRLQRGVTPSLFDSAPRAAAEAEQVQMLALDIRQHQGACNPIEHIDAALGRRAFVRLRSSLRSRDPLNY
jgi:hypothetical protein